MTKKLEKEIHQLQILGHTQKYISRINAILQCIGLDDG